MKYINRWIGASGTHYEDIVDDAIEQTTLDPEYINVKIIERNSKPYIGFFAYAYNENFEIRRDELIPLEDPLDILKEML